MKVAIFSESSTDEAGIRVLVDAILGQPTEPVAVAGIRSRGWDSVRANLSMVYKQLYFNFEADGLVVVADSDDSPVHQQAHESPGMMLNDCRLCTLLSIIEQERNRCPKAPNRAQFRTAVGVAVPAIEAWFLAGKNIHVTEQAWARGPKGRTFDRRSLKNDLYGERANLPQQTAKMVEEAKRLAADISVLEQRFPAGFGSILRQLRTW